MSAARGMRGGFSLRKKPLGGVLPGYSYSGFAVASSARSVSPRANQRHELKITGFRWTTVVLDVIQL
jgi:hypothetical protein